MSFTVHWLLEAMITLLRVLHESGDSAAVIASIEEMSQRLATAPDSADAISHEGLWRLSVGRLRVLYEINYEDRTVEIVGVRLLK